MTHTRSMFQKVVDFHLQFGVPVGDCPQTLSKEDAAFRVKFMREELLEYMDALETGDIVKQFDALIDLVYVALGTAAWQGFPIDEGFDIVHAANMRKIRAESKAHSEQSTGRGHAFDIVKPEGWRAPDKELGILLVAHGLTSMTIAGAPLEHAT